MLLTAEEARRLDGLTLGPVSASPVASALGARVVKARGFGNEFHDFRHYEPGDDPRSIEWTIYTRLGQLVTRTYRADAQLRVHMLVDASASMGIGSPDKFSSARRVAALLAYIGLRERDALGVTTFGETVRQRVAPAVGRTQLFRVFETLSAETPRGPSSIGRVLMQYGAVERGPGLVVVISDFFDPAGVFDGLRYLLHRRLTPALVQVLSDEELDPRLPEDVELEDIEAPGDTPLRVDSDVVRAYKQRLTEQRASLGEFCVTHGLPWIEVGSADRFATVVQACRRAGIVSSHG